MAGWIKLHRPIQTHWLWEDKPFSKGQAWIDLLLMANHTDNKFLLGNDVVVVERGTFITSELKLMERWGWSKTKVRGFLNLLQKECMLEKKTDKKKTTLTIVNYSVYQETQTTEEPQENHKETMSEPQADHEETMERPQKDTNKNEKNVKNVKNEKNIKKKEAPPPDPFLNGLSEAEKAKLRAELRE